MGISNATSLIGEIIVFAYTSQLLNRLGPKRMMVLTFFVQFVWFFGLALIHDPNMIPFFQFLGAQTSD